MTLFINIYQISLQQLEDCPSVCTVQYFTGAWPNSLASLKASAWCHLIAELSTVSLFCFLGFFFVSPQAQSVGLCFARRLIVYLASSSGTGCHGKLSQTPSLSAPWYSSPSPQPAPSWWLVLEQNGSLRALCTLHYFWLQSNRKSIQGSFPLSEILLCQSFAKNHVDF